MFIKFILKCFVFVLVLVIATASVAATATPTPTAIVIVVAILVTINFHAFVIRNFGILCLFMFLFNSSFLVSNLIFPLFPTHSR